MALGKKVLFSRPRASVDVEKVDEWVSQGAEEVVEVGKPLAKRKAAPVDAKVKMKRLSMDLPEEMHKDLMKYCVDHGTKASILVREMLQKKIYK